MSRLNALKERIEAIEALVTIDLDHRRNELTAFDLVSHCCCSPEAKRRLQNWRI